MHGELEQAITVASFHTTNNNLGWTFVELPENHTDPVKCVSGTFTASVARKSWRALFPIFNFVDNFLGNITPDVVVCEHPFRGFVTGTDYNCSALVLACCGKHELNVEFVKAHYVNEMVTGLRKPNKSELRRGVIATLDDLGCTDFNFDTNYAAQAIANAIAFIIDSMEIG